MISLIMTKQGNQLDASVRQKAFTFLQKITSDDTSPGLHIEKIEGARDPRVRTGRVDLQYRAVLFKLTAGDDTTYVFHGIWNHDDAIATAKKTTLKVNPVNGIPEIRELGDLEDAPGWPLSEPVAREPLPLSPTDETAVEPLVRAGRAELVEGLGLDPAVADAALAATTEDDLVAAAEGAPEWQRLALVGLGAGMSVDEVRAELGAEGEPAELPADLESDESVLQSLDRPEASIEFARIDGVDELRRVIESGDFGAWRVFLHPEQRRYATVPTSGAYRLSGGAGTGKTVVLLHRAKHLAGVNPGARLVLTTYTVNLADALRRDLLRLDPDLPIATALGETGIYITGVDALAREVTRSAGGAIADAVAAVLGVGRTDVSRITDSAVWRTVADDPRLPEALRSPHFLADEYELIVLPQRILSRDDYLRVRRPGRGVRLSRPERAAVWSAIERYRQLAQLAGSLDFAEFATIAATYLDATQTRLADHALVDEGQDMGPAHWQLLRALVEPGPNDLFIAEDSHQRIYGSRLVLSQYGINIRGRSRRLTLNYRTTAQNLSYAVAILAGGSYEDLEAEPETTGRYRSARSGVRPVLRGFVGVSDELDFTAETVARWLRQPGIVPETIAILVRDSRQRALVASGLSERGVPVHPVDRGRPPAGQPVVMTMHRAKGMEFANVLLFGISEGSVPMGLPEYGFSDADRADALLRERSLLYVAASRARDELVVTWSGERSHLAPSGA